jgi:hypothetical protein
LMLEKVNIAHMHILHALDDLQSPPNSELLEDLV